jgi:AcrR family transcriptional regulator
MTEPTPVRRKRGRPAIPKDVQRNRLVEAATRAFRVRPYDEVRVADIVAEAGMSSRSFYEHFDSKEDLVASVVQEAGQELLDDLRALFEQVEHPVERIDRGLRLFLDLFGRVPVDIETLGGSAGQRVREVRRDTVREITDLVLAELVLWHESGHTAKPPDPVYVELVLTGIEGMAFRYYSEDRRDELSQLHPTIMELLQRAFLG